jgi:hypothetical protein
MAGSFKHIVNEDDGSFTMEYIENMADAREALEECHALISYLNGGSDLSLVHACAAVGAPCPRISPRGKPVDPREDGGFEQGLLAAGRAVFAEAQRASGAELEALHEALSSILLIQAAYARGKRSK